MKPASWIGLAVLAALLWRSARLGHAGPAFALGVMATVLILVLRALPLRRAARDLRRVAGQLTDTSPHELLPTRLASAAHLDRRYFELTTHELLKLGYVHLGDLEDKTLTEARPVDGRFGTKLAVCMRAFRSATGTSTVLIAQLGAADDATLLLECSTTWSDGRELVTNRSGRQGFEPPPYRTTQILPDGISTLELVRTHERALEDSSAAGDTPNTVATIDSFVEEYNASIARAGLFRAGRGGVKLDELSRAAGPERRAVLEQVLAFMRVEGDVIGPEARPDRPER